MKGGEFRSGLSLNARLGIKGSCLGSDSQILISLDAIVWPLVQHGSHNGNKSLYRAPWLLLELGVFLRKTRILDLKRSNHGESIAFPGKLFQRLITLPVKNLYLISNLIFSGFSFQPLDLVMPLSAQLKNAKASNTISICQCSDTEISVAGSHEDFGRIWTTNSSFAVCLQIWLRSQVKRVNVINF